MNRDKKLVLVIVQENWSEVFPGDWAKTSWLVYENRAVTRKDEFGCSAQDAVTKESNFILNELLYQEILRLVEMVKIRDPHVEILDGEAWGD